MIKGDSQWDCNPTRDKNTIIQLKEFHLRNSLAKNSLLQKSRLKHTLSGISGDSKESNRQNGKNFKVLHDNGPLCKSRTLDRSYSRESRRNSQYDQTPSRRNNKLEERSGSVVHDNAYFEDKRKKFWSNIGVLQQKNQIEKRKKKFWSDLRSPERVSTMAREAQQKFWKDLRKPHVIQQ